MSIPMALVDFIPVIAFAFSAVSLQRALYERASKGAFALFAGGTIFIVCAGFMKALWKLLYAANICDFERLNQAFFPTQSLGFLLAGIAVIAIVFFPQKKPGVMAAAAPTVFSGTMVFVAGMVLGALGFCGGLGILAWREKKKVSAVLFFLTFVFMMMMGYLSSRDFTQASMNWIAEGVNIIGQGLLFVAAQGLAGKTYDR